MSLLLVLVQFVCLLGLIFTGPLLVRQPVGLSLETAAGILVLWSVWTMRKSRLTALPEVAEGARLITGGPYSAIRHPMYASALLLALGLAIGRPTPLRLALVALLALDLGVKIHREERFLRARFPEYDEYARRTKRLIPFLF